MLLSDEKTAAYLQENFELSWESVRPVPKITVEFGNGEKLERTLKGNTVIYVCKPDGTVIDALPGVYKPQDFLKQLEPALQQGASVTADGLPEWHRAQVGEFAKAESRTTMSKMVQETPLLWALGWQEPGKARDWNSKEVQLPTDPELKAAFDKISQRIEDLSVKPMPGSMAARIAAGRDTSKLTEEQVAEIILNEDSRANVRYVRPAVHLLLASLKAPAQPQDLTNAIFKQLLHIPIDDPYLGLAPVDMPGTPGKKGK